MTVLSPVFLLIHFWCSKAKAKTYNMKNLLFVLICSLAMLAITVAPKQVDAQTTYSHTVVKDSTVDAGTTTFTFGAVKSTSVSFTIYGTKVSGTVAGKYVFQGSNDGTYWEGIDSLTLGDYGVNYKTFAVPTGSGSKPKFAQFRIHCVGSGTNKVKPITVKEMRRE
jgi:hypothetical protein